MNVDLHYPKQRLVRYRAISIGLAVFAFCIGGVALLGWILDNPYLKRIHPSLVTMKANTAVCLMLVAVPCFLINDRSPSQFNTVIRRLFAAIVALIGLVTLSEHLFGWNTGLDQLLFHESVQEAGLSFPGRMGVAASLNFFFLGIALLFQDARTRRAFRVSNLAVILVVTVTLLVAAIKTFDIVFVMTRGGPNGASSVIGYVFYDQVFQRGRGGYGASAAVLMLVLVLPIMVFSIRQFRLEESRR